MRKVLGPDEILRFLNRRGAWGFVLYDGAKDRKIAHLARGSERADASIHAIDRMGKMGEIHWRPVHDMFVLSDLGKKTAERFPRWESK